MRKLTLISFLLFWLFGQFSPVALLAASPIQMTVQPAYGGRFKFGEWLPIFVNLENSGTEVSGEVQVSVTNDTGHLDFALPVELPAGARKRVTLYILPNNFSRSAKVKFVVAPNVMGHADETLTSRLVKLTVLPNDRYVIGASMANADGVATMSPPQLEGRREPAELVSLTLDELPDRPEGLRVLNALVLNDVDTTLLSPAQQTALSRWVAEGGRLVLGGGAGAGRTLAGLPAELHPVAPGQLQEVPNLPGLEAYTGKTIRVPGPFLVTAAEPVPKAAVLLERTQMMAARPGLSASTLTSPSTFANDLPLVTELSFEAGLVDFVALDLSQSPFDAWAGVTDFAERLLSPGAAWPQTMPMDMSPQHMVDSQMSYALTNLPALDLPSIRFLGILLIGYVVLVGPVNFWVLRWRDRLAWAWLTIPVLTLAFSGLAYGIGLGLRGSDIIVNQISVLQLGSDGQASRANTYVGIFSPNRQSYDIEIPVKTLIRPLTQSSFDAWTAQPNSNSSMRVVQGEPARVRGLAINQWSMQSFMAETIVTARPGLVAQLIPTQDGLQGQVMNQSEETWQDVILVFNTQFQKLGDLAPGQQADINLTINDTNPVMGIGSYLLYQEEFNQPNGPGREMTLKQSVMDNTVFNSSRFDLNDHPILMAWHEKSSPLEVRVSGREISTQKTTFLYGPLPLNFNQPQVTVPPGLSRLDALATTGNVSPCIYSLGLDGYYVYQGQAELKLSLPDHLRNVQPERLSLLIRTDGSWPELPSVDLYDQAAQAWIPLQKAKLGLNPIQDTTRFYDQTEASLKLRLSHDGVDGGGCLFLDLTLKGSHL